MVEAERKEEPSYTQRGEGGNRQRRAGSDGKQDQVQTGSARKSNLNLPSSATCIGITRTNNASRRARGACFFPIWTRLVPHYLVSSFLRSVRAQSIRALPRLACFISCLFKEASVQRGLSVHIVIAACTLVSASIFMPRPLCNGGKVGQHLVSLKQTS